MEKETLYKFFDGKASREEKEAVRIWLESSPENEQELFKEREFFDAMILSGSTKVAGMEKKSRPFYRTVLLEAIKIAAVFAITVASGTYFYKSEICKIGEAMNTITVPAGTACQPDFGGWYERWAECPFRNALPGCLYGQ